MTSWLRRLSRDRGSKYAEDYPPPDNDMNAAFRPHSSYHHSENSTRQPEAIATKDSQFPPTPTSGDMLRNSNRGGDPQHWSSPTQPPQPPNNAMTNSSSTNMEAPPDLLTRAFNETLRPYQERVHLLQADLESAHQQIQRLESEKAEMHNWIDKRGLRPDLPPELSAGLATNSPVAASTLATQLDRKMTMLNYSLHHLADALPSAPPTSTVTSSLSALLPNIQHLSTLPAGPPFAFESLIKLAGNLNSHSTGEETDADRQSIENFYNDLDQVMVRVVGKRVAGIVEGEENWDVGRDVKRLEKTGAFLRKEMGVRNYFLKSLEVMKGEGRGRANQGEPLTRYSSDSH
ncbi:MAG: hypothetical protein MMC23_006143 [Stictis urceolatum]|nr:hypothetical protein [Stictis urceolata]